MQYYSSPKNLSFEEIVQDFERLMAGVDHVFEIRLIGGEPFMNKDIYRILEHNWNTKSFACSDLYQCDGTHKFNICTLLRDKK